MHLRRCWSFLVCLVIVLMYYRANNIVENQSEKPSTVLKKIVAYSLRKQIEFDGHEFTCQNLTYKINHSQSTFWNKVPNMEIFITSVYLDSRLEPYKYLRIIAANKANLNETIYCRIIMNSDHVLVVRATVMPIWYEKWNANDKNTYYNPVLISCRVPALNLIPMGISLSKKPCDTIYKMFNINIPKETKHNFTVCIKPLDFMKDISMHLVRWIEISKILGAQYFYFFIKNVTKETRRILNWYKSQYPRNFRLENFIPIETQCENCTTSVWQKRKYEIITYNKCFYSNLNSQYVIPLDTDEIILPKTYKNWSDLIQKHANNVSSIMVQNVYFFTKEIDFFKVKFRTASPNKQGENSKSFISTKNTLTVFNHYSLHSLRPGTIRHIFLPFKDVQLNHYKESCDRMVLPECNHYALSPTIFDNTIDRYKDQFDKEYGNVLKRIRKYIK
ncbi:uncharacterized protein LOC126740526 [Anthonomus grandis grandis]|uniref:uncharacterized protein LOC126740526 n=1 Tax=Anthonomus grandis grandis TaxID=2921223 RepID=UPI002165517B|nr:uncharacterized protein LOC126740526 [Anthonomus grandis grandis]